MRTHLPYWLTGTLVGIGMAAYWVYAGHTPAAGLDKTTPPVQGLFDLPTVQAETLSSAPLGLFNVPGGSSGTAGNPLLSPDLIRIFEQLLGRIGQTISSKEKPDKAALLGQAKARIGEHVPPALQAQALDILGRYLDYRLALLDLAPPPIHDAASIAQTFAAQQRLRSQFFSDVEARAFFGAEDQYNRFTVERLTIQNNSALTNEQKKAALLQAEQQWLSPEQRAQRAEVVSHLSIAEHTQTMAQQGLTEHQRYSERSGLYGEATAQRLATLDQQEADWLQRLNRYAQADEPTRKQLLATQFTESERLRVPGALGLLQLNTAQK